MKSCRVCRKKYIPIGFGQVVCSIPCSIKWIEKGRKKKQKEQRKFDRERKLKLKSRSKWLSEAQSVFNQYIRLRDKDRPCISCNRHHEGQYHAGHYRSVGACPELRFEELNVWKQCAPCNNHLSGNPIEYRKTLLVMLGSEKLDWIEGPHNPKKYNIAEITEIKAKYSKLVRDLKKTDN